MKKEVLILGLILFVFAGCSSDSTADEKENVSYESSEALLQENESPEPVSQANTLGDFTFFEGESVSDDRDTGVDVISLEEAAQIGANYILELLENNLEGAYMQLVYSYNWHLSLRTWSGVIGSSREGIEDWNDMPINFLIHAETGEKISLMNNWNVEPLMESVIQ